MRRGLRGRLEGVYERLLEREVSGAPTHVAVIQDGNRRYAIERGAVALGRLRAPFYGVPAVAVLNDGDVGRRAGDLPLQLAFVHAFEAASESGAHLPAPTTARK